MPAPPQRSPRRGAELEIPWGWVAPLLIAIVACVAFSPAFSADYVSWDDIDNFVENTRWHGLAASNIRWAFTTMMMGHYHPLTWLTFEVQYALFGAAPASAHAFNIAVHAANAVLFYLLSRRLLALCFPEEDDGLRGYSPRLALSAAFAAGVFALHPLRVESVAWITERRDVLSTLLLLVAALAYLRAAAPGQRVLRSRRWYGIAVGLALLSCLSKAWGMTFFVVLLALDWYPLQRLARTPPSRLYGWLTPAGFQLIVEKTPFILIGLATAALGGIAQRAAQASLSLADWGVRQRLLQAVYGLWFYIFQTVIPHGHSPLYQLPDDLRPTDPRLFPAYIALVVLVAAFVWGLRRAPAAAVAIALYAVLISPVLGLNQSGVQLVADRYSYLATMPLLVLAGGGMLLALRSPWATAGRIKAVAAGAGILLMGLSVLSYAQSMVWRDSITLWEHAVSVTPTSQVLAFYAAAIQPQDPDAAFRAYKRAVEIDPRLGRAWIALASEYQRRGMTSEAIEAYRSAAPMMKQAYIAHQNLGIIYYFQGRRQEAIEQYKLGIADVERPDQLKPSGGPFMVMGQAMLDKDDRPAAIANFRKGLRYNDTREKAAARLRELGEQP